MPPKQGLYDPQLEHDSCGVGFLVDLKGKRSHKLVQDAIDALNCLNHRGAQGAEVNTGDGAGLLVQLPDEFFRHECAHLNIKLPAIGTYGVGFLFASPDEPSASSRRRNWGSSSRRKASISSAGASCQRTTRASARQR